MANTTNFDLVKPSGSDAYNISSFHNGSMDKIDSALQGLGTGLAIISKGNTHAAVTNGQFVYVHGHDTLAEGMYKASSNIAANATLSSSNLTAASGGLGAEVATLSEQIGTLNSNLQSLKMYVCIDVEFTFNGQYYSTPIDISSLTNGIVRSSNVLAVLATGIGHNITAVFASNKLQVEVHTIDQHTIATTATATLVFYYT